MIPNAGRTVAATEYEFYEDHVIYPHYYEFYSFINGGASSWLNLEHKLQSSNMT